MADTVSPETRSRMMAAIRSKDTSPELAVRRALHALGFRYSLHAKRLPGKPDIVLPKYGAVIFVEGCFWHGHDCGRARIPSSRTEFWQAKIDRNKARDAQTRAELDKLGWRHLTVWECALKGKGAPGIEAVTEMAAEWLCSGAPSSEIRE